MSEGTPYTPRKSDPKPCSYCGKAFHPTLAAGWGTNLGPGKLDDSHCPDPECRDKSHAAWDAALKESRTAHMRSLFPEFKG
jgi:hypothetical protein